MAIPVLPGRATDRLDAFGLPEVSPVRRGFVRTSRSEEAKRVHHILSYRFARLTEDLWRLTREVNDARDGDARFARSNAFWAARSSALTRKIDPGRFSDVGSMLRHLVDVLKRVRVDRRAPPDYIREKFFALVEHFWFESACA